MRSAMVGHDPVPRGEIYGVKCPSKTYVVIAPDLAAAEHWIAEMAGQCSACGGAPHRLMVAPLGDWSGAS